MTTLLQTIPIEDLAHHVAELTEQWESIPVAETPTDHDRGWWDAMCDKPPADRSNFDYMVGYYEGQLDNPNSACYNPNRQFASHQEGQPSHGFIEF